MLIEWVGKLRERRPQVQREENHVLAVGNVDQVRAGGLQLQLQIGDT